MLTAEDYWIVRCGSAATLATVARLRELGFDAWSPTVERQYRKARSKKYVRVCEPMLTTFVFVRMGEDPAQCAERLDDLRWLIGIRVMRENGRFAGVANKNLSALRALEAEAGTFGIDNLVKRDNFTIGQRGSVDAIAFMGLACTLVDRVKDDLLVLLDKATTPIVIKAALFRPDAS